MLCILSKDGCKIQSTLGKEWVEEILDRILLMSSFMDSIEFMVLCWCRKLLKI